MSVLVLFCPQAPNDDGQLDASSDGAPTVPALTLSGGQSGSTVTCRCSEAAVNGACPSTTVVSSAIQGGELRAAHMCGVRAMLRTKPRVHQLRCCSRRTSLPGEAARARQTSWHPVSRSACPAQLLTSYTTLCAIISSFTSISQFQLL